MEHNEELKRELDKGPGDYEEPGVNPDPDGRNMTRLVHETVTEIARVQTGHTAQLKEVRAVQKQHTAQLRDLQLAQSQQTATLNQILLKVEDLGASSSDSSWEKFQAEANYSGIDRQLRDLRKGQGGLGSKVDRILVHLGIAEGE
jgi:uncharacterized protein (DUF885 family)